MQSLSTLFASETLVRILAHFLMNAEKAYYQAEIQKQVQGTLRNTQKMLLKLEAVGLIRSYKQGNMTYYQAVKTHPAFEDLKRLFLKTVVLGELLRQALETHSNKVAIAFIFGSFAKGNETADSDIDLFILGDLSLKEASQALGPIIEETGREINPVTYTAKAFTEKYAANNHFVLELLSCPKIWLLGSEDELNALVGGRETETPPG